MMKEAAMKKEVDNPAGTKEEAVVVVVIEAVAVEVEVGVVDPEAVAVEVEAASTVVMKDIRVENALKNV